jgi:hypothetical protein
VANCLNDEEVVVDRSQVTKPKPDSIPVYNRNIFEGTSAVFLPRMGTLNRHVVAQSSTAASSGGVSPPRPP